MIELPSENEAPPYYLLPLDNLEEVEAWSLKRLSYMPHDWRKTFCEELRASVNVLNAKPNQVLHAVYASHVEEFCDIENILLYNVGSGKFHKAARFGICFERGTTIPSCPRTLRNTPQHYHKYALRSKESSFVYWKKGKRLADWQISGNNYNTLRDCTLVWYAIKQGVMTSYTEGQSHIPQFGVQMTLTSPPAPIPPARTPVRIVDVIKPLFDGAIAALHQYNGPEEIEISERLAVKLRITPEKIRRLLQSDYATVLGKRRVVHSWGKNVQWNPADDQCFAGELRLETTNTSENWNLHGEVFAITRADAL